MADNWFNSTYDLNLQKDQLTQLLRMASTDQLFQFDGQLYEQCEGVAMGSPLGPLLANVFMCHLEETLSDNDLIPSFYKRYVDDTLAIMPGLDAAESFLNALNGLHPSIHFTMELSNNDSIPFIRTLITKNSNKLETQVYRKPFTSLSKSHRFALQEVSYRNNGSSCKGIVLFASSIRR